MDNKISLIACPDCDLLHRDIQLNCGMAAVCSRCGAVLYTPKRNSLDRALMFSITGLIFFVPANLYPFMIIERAGLMQENILISGVFSLYEEGMWILASVVFIASILAPLLELLAMLYILLPLKFNRVPWKLALLFRIMNSLRPWAMMEVYMLGILTAIVKLSETASLVIGIGLYSFTGLLLAAAAAGASLDPRIVWERVEIYSRVMQNENWQK